MLEQAKALLRAKHDRSIALQDSKSLEKATAMLEAKYKHDMASQKSALVEEHTKNLEEALALQRSELLNEHTTALESSLLQQRTKHAETLALHRSQHQAALDISAKARAGNMLLRTLAYSHCHCHSPSHSHSECFHTISVSVLNLGTESEHRLTKLLTEAEKAHQEHVTRTEARMAEMNEHLQDTHEAHEEHVSHRREHEAMTMMTAVAAVAKYHKRHKDHLRASRNESSELAIDSGQTHLDGDDTSLSAARPGCTIPNALHGDEAEQKVITRNFASLLSKLTRSPAGVIRAFKTSSRGYGEARPNVAGKGNRLNSGDPRGKLDEINSKLADMPLR